MVSLPPLKQHRPKFLRAQEDYVVWQDRLDKVYFLSTSSQGFLSLLKPCERAIRVLLDRESVYLLVVESSSNFLHIYSVGISGLQRGVCERVRILENSAIECQQVVQVDTKHLAVVVKTEESLEVWDLREESIVFKCSLSLFHSVVYSRYNIITRSFSPNGCQISVRNLSTQETKQVFITALNNCFLTDFVQGKLIVGSSGRPVQVIDIGGKTQTFMHRAPVKAYVETEYVDDILIVFADGHAQFGSKSDKVLNFDYKSSLFCESEDYLALFDGKRVNVFSSQGDLLSTAEVNLPCKVTDVAFNQDTSEILLVCKDGDIAVFD